MGCATAYYLLRNDSHLDVAILERDPSYSKASTTLSDGNIRIQFNLKENIQMSQYGLEMLEQFAEEMAVDGQQPPDVAFRRQGDLFLFDEQGRDSARAGYEQQVALDCAVEWLTPEDIEERFPLIDVRQLAGGTFGHGEGTMDPHAVLQGFKNKAIALGADYIPQQAQSLLVQQGSVQGIRLASAAKLKAKIIVNSAGPWLPLLAETAGVHLPIEPVKRQVFVLETQVDAPQALPLIVFPTGLYLIQEYGSQFLCGKSLADDPVTLTDFSWKRQQFEERLWPDLVTFMPSFDRLKVVNGWAGLYSVNTFDGNAIVGQWPEIEGLFLAGGFSGHGFQQAFAVGRYLAESILELTPSLDLSIFGPQRILEDRPVFEGAGRLV